MKLIYIIQSVVLKPSASIKNISVVCIYFHGSAASGPASFKGSHERQSRDLANLLGLLPSFGDKCLVNNSKEMKKKSHRCLLFSLSFRLDFFFFLFFQFEKTKLLKCTEGGAFRCDSESRRGPWVTWWFWGGGVGW